MNDKQQALIDYILEINRILDEANVPRQYRWIQVNRDALRFLGFTESQIEYLYNDEREVR